MQAAVANNIKRVVLTSSVAAVAYGHPKEKTKFKEARATVDALDQELSVDNRRIRETFDLPMYDMKAMVLSMEESMIELKML